MLKAHGELSGNGGRIIPSNTKNLHITYQNITLNGLIGAEARDIAIASPDVTAQTVTVTLNDFAAAIANNVTVLAQDALNGNSVAMAVERD